MRNDHGMKTRATRTLAAVASLVAAVTVAAPLAAQSGNASAAALGLGGAYTAAARGFDAVAWNPAGLAMPGTGRFSVGIFPVVGGWGATPIGFGELKDHEGDVVDDATKRAWVETIRADGGQSMGGAADATLLGLTIGRFGVQVSLSATGDGFLTGDAAELLLFGNVGFEGEPKAYDIRGTDFTAASLATFAASWAQPLRVGGGVLAIGGTAKLVRGTSFLHGRETGGITTSDPLAVRVRFPIVQARETGAFDDNGGGFAADLGVAWQRGGVRLGAAVQNVVSTFEWDADAFDWKRGVVAFTDDSSVTDFERRPLAEGPEELRRVLDEATLDPTVSAGAAVRLTDALAVSADVRARMGDGLDLVPKSYVGAGVEWAPVPELPIRLGAASMTGGLQFGGGVGLRLGAFTLDASIARRTGDDVQRTLFGITAAVRPR